MLITIVTCGCSARARSKRAAILSRGNVAQIFARIFVHFDEKFQTFSAALFPVGRIFAKKFIRSIAPGIFSLRPRNLVLSSFHNSVRISRIFLVILYKDSFKIPFPSRFLCKTIAEILPGELFIS